MNGISVVEIGTQNYSSYMKKLEIEISRFCCRTVVISVNLSIQCKKLKSSIVVFHQTERISKILAKYFKIFTFNFSMSAPDTR